MPNSPHHPPALSKSPQGVASDQPPPQLQPIKPRLTSSPASQSSASPTPPLLEPRQLRSKRSPVLAACNTCRKKKSRCDGRRPSCGPCLQARKVCAYVVPEGLTVREAQKRKLDETSGANDDYQSVVHLLRHGSEDEAQAAFRRLREAGSVQGTVRSLADASLLLLPSASSSSRPSTTPPEQRYISTLGREPQPPVKSPLPLLESAPRSSSPSPEKPTPARASSLQQDLSSELSA